MRLVVFVMFAFLNSSFASGETLNCSQYISNLPTNPYQCDRVSHLNFPRKIQGINVDFFRYHEGYSNDPGQQKLLQLASEALDESIPQFLQYGLMPDINMIFINEIVDHISASAPWTDVPKGKACGIILNFNIDTEEQAFKQVIAHELTHCFEAKNIFIPEMGTQYSASWWVEGFAEYFSSVIYPNANREYYPEFSFNPSIPLFLQPSPNQNSLFFKYLVQSGVPIKQIISELKKHPKVNSIDKEITAFSKWNQIAENFHNFALTLDRKQLHDPSGKPQPNPQHPIRELTLDSQNGEVRLKGSSASAQKIRIKIPSAGVWKISWDGYDSTKVSYKSDSGDWQPLEQYNEITEDIDCGSQTSSFDILWTTTEPMAEVPLNLRVSAETKDCRCQDSKAVIDSCLKGQWKLNINESNAAIKRYIDEHPPAGGSTIDFSFYGDQIVNIAEGEARTIYKLNPFGNHFRGTNALGEQVIQTEMKGLLKTTFKSGKSGQICVKDESAEGTIQTWNNGEDQGIEPYIPAQTQETPLLYTCTPQKLHLFFDTNDPLFPVYIQQILIYDRVPGNK